MSDFLPFRGRRWALRKLRRFQDVLMSGWITTRPKNQELEEAFCQLTGNQHALPSVQPPRVCVTLMALDIGPGR